MAKFLSRWLVLILVTSLVANPASAGAVGAFTPSVTRSIDSRNVFEREAIVGFLGRFLKPFSPLFTSRLNRILIQLHPPLDPQRARNLSPSNRAPEFRMVSRRQQALEGFRAMEVKVRGAGWVPTVYLEDTVARLQPLAKNDPELLKGFSINLSWKILLAFAWGGLGGFYLWGTNRATTGLFQSRPLFQWAFSHELMHFIVDRRPEIRQQVRAVSWTPVRDVPVGRRLLLFGSYVVAMVLAAQLIYGWIAGLAPATHPLAALGMVGLSLILGMVFSTVSGGMTSTVLRAWLTPEEAYTINTRRPWSFLTLYSLVSPDEEIADLGAALMVFPEETLNKAKHNRALARKVGILKSALLGDEDVVEAFAPLSERNPFSWGWPGWRLTAWVAVAGVWVSALLGYVPHLTGAVIRAVLLYEVLTAIFLIGMRPVIALRVNTRPWRSLVSRSVRRHLRDVMVWPSAIFWEVQKLAGVAALVGTLLVTFSPGLLRFKPWVFLPIRPAVSEVVAFWNAPSLSMPVEPKASISARGSEAWTGLKNGVQGFLGPLQKVLRPSLPASSTGSATKPPSVSTPPVRRPQVFFLGKLDPLPVMPPPRVIRRELPDVYGYFGGKSSVSGVKHIIVGEGQPVVSYPYQIPETYRPAVGEIMYKIPSIQIADIDRIELTLGSSQMVPVKAFRPWYSMFPSRPRIAEGSLEVNGVYIPFAMDVNAHRYSFSGKSIREAFLRYAAQSHVYRRSDLTMVVIDFPLQEGHIFATDPNAMRLQVTMKLSPDVVAKVLNLPRVSIPWPEEVYYNRRQNSLILTIVHVGEIPEDPKRGGGYSRPLEMGWSQLVFSEPLKLPANTYEKFVVHFSQREAGWVNFYQNYPPESGFRFQPNDPNKSSFFLEEGQTELSIPLRNDVPGCTPQGCESRGFAFYFGKDAGQGNASALKIRPGSIELVRKSPQRGGLPARVSRHSGAVFGLLLAAGASALISWGFGDLLTGGHAPVLEATSFLPGLAMVGHWVRQRFHRRRSSPTQDLTAPPPAPAIPIDFLAIALQQLTDSIRAMEPAQVLQALAQQEGTIAERLDRVLLANPRRLERVKNYLARRASDDQSVVLASIDPRDNIAAVMTHHLAQAVKRVELEQAAYRLDQIPVSRRAVIQFLSALSMEGTVNPGAAVKAVAKTLLEVASDPSLVLTGAPDGDGGLAELFVVLDLEMEETLTDLSNIETGHLTRKQFAEVTTLCNSVTRKGDPISIDEIEQALSSRGYPGMREQIRLDVMQVNVWKLLSRAQKGQRITVQDVWNAFSRAELGRSKHAVVLIDKLRKHLREITKYEMIDRTYSLRDALEDLLRKDERLHIFFEKGDPEGDLGDGSFYFFENEVVRMIEARQGLRDFLLESDVAPIVERYRAEVIGRWIERVKNWPKVDEDILRRLKKIERQLTSKTLQVRIRLPTPLRRFVEGRDHVVASGATLGELLEDLVTLHPVLGPHLFVAGRLRSFVHLWIGPTDVTAPRVVKRRWEWVFPDWRSIPMNPEDEVSIVPSVTGGSQEGEENPARHVPSGRRFLSAA